jgi:hypothetical protein
MRSKSWPSCLNKQASLATAKVSAADDEHAQPVSHRHDQATVRLIL